MNHHPTQSAQMLTFASALLLTLMLSCSAQAHPTSNGQTLIHINPESQEVGLLSSVSRKDLGDYLKLDRNGNTITEPEEFEMGRNTVLDYMSPRVTVLNNGAECGIRNLWFAPEGRNPTQVHLMIMRRCDEPLNRLELANSILFEDTLGYRHLARIRLGRSTKMMAATFTREFPTVVLDIVPNTPNTPSAEEAPAEVLASAPSLLNTMVRYTWEGILHILIGLDHVLFVILLLMLAKDARKLVWVITAFTIGHSVTLVISALNLFTVPASFIEPIIALSIVIVAAENIGLSSRDEEPKHRYIITAAFGLIHGFGFSYVLRDEIGLPSETLIPALLTFNIGVELGQLAIVAVIYPLLRLAMKHDEYRYGVWGVSGLVGVLALWWVIERTMGALAG
ncbi:MAG: HupE/UreJ family protein [Myxococcota bacterium]